MKTPFLSYPAMAFVALMAAPSLSAAVISQGAAIIQVAGTGGPTNGTTETVEKVVDGTIGKYYASNGGGSTTALPTLQITPILTSTVIQSVTIFTGNDSIGRDPTMISIFGSNDGINYVPIAVNQTITLPSTGLNSNGSGNEGRNNSSGSITSPGLYSASVGFANTTSYSSYQVRFDSVRTPGNGVQFAELQLSTDLIPEPSSALLAVAGSLGLLARRRR